MEGDFPNLPFKPIEDIDPDAAYNVIFSVFSKLAPNLPAEFFIRFREITLPIRFKQDQVVIDYGDICKHVYFMLSGFVRSTKILKSRGETTVWFIRAGDIMIAVDSFYAQTGSDEKLTALKDTFCIALPWTELQALRQDYNNFKDVVTLLTEHYYRQALARITWYYESPGVRYEHLLKAYPEVAQHVSVKELASYLGIAPETLSRIRHRMARKGKTP